MLLIPILLLGLALRLWNFQGLHLSDDLDYALRAWRLLHHGDLIYDYDEGDEGNVRIGTFAPVALTYRLFGINHFGLVAYPLAVSLLSIVIVYRLGRNLFGVAAGLTAATLLACYPLDVALASCLLPDVLLSGFSCLAFFMLLTADCGNEQSDAPRLSAKWRYLVCGIVLGWCTLVNMSSFVLFLFAAIYFFWSLPGMLRKTDGSLEWRRLGRIAISRYVLVVLGFILVAGLEEALYFRKTGKFFFKYRATYEHFNAPSDVFCKDPWYYPGLMFFVRPGYTFHPPTVDEYSYGYYFLAAVPAIVFAWMARVRRFHIALLWLLVIVCYLQWGSTSFTEYKPLHRLDRHMALATPPLVLVLGTGLSAFWPRWTGKVIWCIGVAGLCGSSVFFAHHRHVSWQALVAPQQVLHDLCNQHRVQCLYATPLTILYQKFLDRYDGRPRDYIPIELAK